MTLGYAEMKKLIVESVDKVTDGADKTITGGRLNVTAAMLALDAMLEGKNSSAAPAAPAQPAVPAPATPAVQPAVQTAQPQPPATPSKPAPTAVCGTSPLAGLSSATQSSTAGGSKANLAIDGECRKRRVWQGSCAQTRESAGAVVCRGWAVVWLRWACSSGITQRSVLCMPQSPLASLAQPSTHPPLHLHAFVPSPCLLHCRVPVQPLVGSQADQPA